MWIPGCGVSANATKEEVHTAWRELAKAYHPDRLAALGLRAMLPPHLAAEAAGDLGAALVPATDYETHRIALGVPRGGLDFSYRDAFPHEADMDPGSPGARWPIDEILVQEAIDSIESIATAIFDVVTTP